MSKNQPPSIDRSTKPSFDKMFSRWSEDFLRTNDALDIDAIQYKMNEQAIKEFPDISKDLLSENIYFLFNKPVIAGETGLSPVEIFVNSKEKGSLPLVSHALRLGIRTQIGLNLAEQINSNLGIEDRKVPQTTSLSDSDIRNIYSDERAIETSILYLRSKIFSNSDTTRFKDKAYSAIKKPINLIKSRINGRTANPNDINFQKFADKALCQLMHDIPAISLFDDNNIRTIGRLIKKAYINGNNSHSYLVGQINSRCLDALIDANQRINNSLNNLDVTNALKNYKDPNKNFSTSEINSLKHNLTISLEQQISLRNTRDNQANYIGRKLNIAKNIINIAVSHIPSFVSASNATDRIGDKAIKKIRRSLSKEVMEISQLKKQYQATKDRAGNFSDRIENIVEQSIKLASQDKSFRSAKSVLPTIDVKKKLALSIALTRSIQDNFFAVEGAQYSATNAEIVSSLAKELVERKILVPSTKYHKVTLSKVDDNILKISLDNAVTKTGNALIPNYNNLSKSTAAFLASNTNTPNKEVAPSLQDSPANIKNPKSSKAIKRTKEAFKIISGFSSQEKENQKANLNLGSLDSNDIDRYFLQPNQLQIAQESFSLIFPDANILLSNQQNFAQDSVALLAKIFPTLPLLASDKEIAGKLAKIIQEAANNPNLEDLSRSKINNVIEHKVINQVYIKLLESIHQENIRIYDAFDNPNVNDTIFLTNQHNPILLQKLDECKDNARENLILTTKLKEDHTKYSEETKKAFRTANSALKAGLRLVPHSELLVIALSRASKKTEEKVVTETVANNLNEKLCKLRELEPLAKEDKQPIKGGITSKESKALPKDNLKISSASTSKSYPQIATQPYSSIGKISGNNGIICH